MDLKWNTQRKQDTKAGVSDIFEFRMVLMFNKSLYLSFFFIMLYIRFKYNLLIISMIENLYKNRGDIKVLLKSMRQ